MDNFKFFKTDEFKCPCCNQNKISLKLIEKLDQARQIANVPFKINSGYRCEKHNKEIGGEENSAHTRGYAADISATDSQTRYKIISALLQVGFNRIGIYKSWIHADIDSTLPQMVVWYK